ncbi:UNVERIFIED_CONTAM: hypothetical protein FKN15_052066 [Acipenser sinensis]
MILINARTVKDTTMPRLSNEDRLVAIGMIEGGLSVREVARRMRCSASTISRLVQRNQETGSVRDRPRPGRPQHTGPRPRPANLCQLAAAAQEKRQNIPQQTVQRLNRSMRQRCQDCVNAQGGHTR